MNPAPLVSVVVPVYNMEAFVADTLHSILASDYPNLEVVVVNDGSTDRSLEVVQGVAAKDERVRVLSMENGGVCRARNCAIEAARGIYILPVDADNLLEPHFIAEAVALMADETLKAVAPRAVFFGARTGEWKLPEFSLSLLARKNILDTCALYRRADWERVGGYCTELDAREDWEFWISVLKDGGRVVRTARTGLHYRVREGSKRVTDRQKKREVVALLNRRHPAFFERELGGPLRLHRSWSRLLNRLHRLLCPQRLVLAEGCEAARYDVRALTRIFQTERGRVIHRRRNELRELTLGGRRCVVKSFQVPHLLNRFVYGLLRPSKAQRSFEYAQLLRREGIGSPAPVAWLTERRGLLLRHSYYVSECSTLRHTYADLIGGNFPEQERYLTAIARMAAQLHEAGMIHRDFSRGNILFDDAPDGGVRLELVDLNRLRFHAVGLEEGCRNFERLPMTPSMLRIVATAYAEARHADVDRCIALFEASPRETH